MLNCSSSGIRIIQNERLFSAEQFRCTPLEEPPDKESTCQCTTKYCPRDDHLHGCHCNINASFRLRRHNEIQRVHKDYIKKRQTEQAYSGPSSYKYFETKFGITKSVMIASLSTSLCVSVIHQIAKRATCSMNLDNKMLLLYGIKVHRTSCSFRNLMNNRNT